MTEILMLKLKPGTGQQFAKLYVNEALPLLLKWNFKILAHGLSLHDDTIYYVLRHFNSLEHRQKMEDAYYNSDDWQKGPRTAVFALVQSYQDIVIGDETLKSCAAIM